MKDYSTRPGAISTGPAVLGVSQKVAKYADPPSGDEGEGFLFVAQRGPSFNTLFGYYNALKRWLRSGFSRKEAAELR
jgi:hypothetical protein